MLLRSEPARRATTVLALTVGLVGVDVGAAPALRVCVADIAYPPSITLDPRNPGTRERQFVEAGRLAGVAVSLHYAPIRRCHRMVRDGELDVVYMAATPESLPAYRFPLNERGQPDRALRLKEETVLLVQHHGQTARWDGLRFSAPVRLGTRAGLRMAHEAARSHHLSLADDSAADAEQALRMVAAGRYDFAVLLEVDLRGQATTLGQLGLEVLPQPMARFDGFMVGSLRLAPDRLPALEAWWRALPRLAPVPGPASRPSGPR